MNFWQEYKRSASIAESIQDLTSEFGSAKPESTCRIFAKLIRVMRASPPAVLGTPFDSK